MIKTNHTKREVWTVKILDMNGYDKETYHVFATMASQAEKRGLEIAKVDKEHEFNNPYCSSASFTFYVY